MGLPPQLAAVVIDGSHAHESGDLLLSDLSQLGQFGNQDSCGGGADAGDGTQYLAAQGKARLGLCRGLNAPVLHDDPGFEIGDVFGDIVQNVGGFGVFEPLLFHHQHIDQLPAAADTIGEPETGLIGRWRRGWLHGLSEAHHDGGVNLVGLGELSAGACKVAYLAGIDPAQGKALTPGFTH